jgi:hypothetical protein
MGGMRGDIAKFGDPCKGCGIALDPLNTLWAGRWLNRFCKSCINEKHRIERAESKTNPVLKRKYQNYDLKKNYGISIDDYDKLLELQNGQCVICGKTGSSVRSLAVDHNHKTGKIRGLLCIKCNVWVGDLEKNPEIFGKIKSYLQKHNEIQELEMILQHD